MALMRVQKNFSKLGRRLRQHIEEIDQSRSDPRRFSWDLWDIPGQYHLLRCPAEHLLPRQDLQNIQSELVEWGRKHLGCHTITPLWISAYVDGCEQRLHVDAPHGPWAFVYSLCPPRPRFKGGATLLLRDSILNYWSSGARPGRSFESAEIFQSIRPDFNQLLVFDGRVPHGVERVSQAANLSEARIVIHGWYQAPRPYVDGPHPRSALARFTKEFLTLVAERGLFQFESRGFFCLRFFVSPAGKISRVYRVSSTIQAADHLRAQVAQDEALALKLVSQLSMKPIRSKHGSWITFPIEIG